MRTTNKVGKLFEGRWEYKGKNTFTNIYNNTEFKCSKSSTLRIFKGVSTVSQIIAKRLNGDTVRKREMMHYIKERKL